MSEKFTIKQLYEYADIISLRGIKELLKDEHVDVKDLSNMLQALIKKQAVDRNKLRRKKIAVLIKIYIDDNNSVSDTVDQLKTYINDENKVAEIKAKLLTKKEAQDDDDSYEILIEDLKDYLDLYDDMKTIDDISKNMK